MRLVMCLLVRDEADVIRENLDFHFSQGVDLTIVMDNRSKDGTTEILREYEARGAIRLLDQRGVYDQRAWMTEMAQLAVETEGADWVLPNDGDEFWLPRQGTLKEVLEPVPPSVGGLVCRRVTFVPTPDDGRPWWERMTLRQSASLNAAGKPLPPKVIHRATPGLEIRKGNHHRQPPEVGETLAFDQVEVLHFKMRTFKQFEHGVIAMGRAMKRAERPNQQVGRVRRREFEIWRDGGLEAFYAERVVDGVNEEVVEDTRLRDHLAFLQAASGAATPRSPFRGLAGAAGAVRRAPRRIRSGAAALCGRRARAVPPAPFVVGVPRSGTTLLRLMLDAHPDLAIPAETHFIPDLIARWRELETQGVPVRERCADCVELIVSHRRWKDLDVDAGELRAHLAAIRSPELADLVRAVPVVHARHMGKPRWGEKTPGYLARMRRIRKVLPEARFVHVIRDGRDVAVSLAGVSWATDDAVVAARRWKRRIRAARRQARRMPSGSYSEVRYEDLVSDPERELRRIAGFLSLPWDDAMLAYHEGAGERMAGLVRDMPAAGGGLVTAEERRSQHALVSEPPRTDRVGRWRTQMEPASRLRFEEVAGDLLEELGYARDRADGA